MWPSAILCALFFTAVVLALLGRRSARLELAGADALRAAGRARQLGLVMLDGRVETADEERVVVTVTYPPHTWVTRAGGATEFAPMAVATARRFWLATDEGVVAVEPQPGAFAVDARDRPPYSTPDTAGSTLTIADGAILQVEGWLRRDGDGHTGPFRGDGGAWAIGAPDRGKLRLTDRSLTLSLQRRLDRWTFAVIGSVIAAVASLVPAARAATSAFAANGELGLAGVALVIVVVLLGGAHHRGPELPWVEG